MLRLLLKQCLDSNDLESSISCQPRPQGLLLIQNGGSEKLLNGSKNSWGFCHVKHDEMSSFCLNKVFRLQENKQDCQTLETTSKKAISSCVTWTDTQRFLEYFSSLSQGFLLSAILNKGMALGTRLVSCNSYVLLHLFSLEGCMIHDRSRQWKRIWLTMLEKLTFLCSEPVSLMKVIHKQICWSWQKPKYIIFSCPLQRVKKQCLGLTTNQTAHVTSSNN